MTSQQYVWLEWRPLALYNLPSCTQWSTPRPWAQVPWVHSVFFLWCCPFSTQHQAHNRFLVILTSEHCWLTQLQEAGDFWLSYKTKWSGWGLFIVSPALLREIKNGWTPAWVETLSKQSFPPGFSPSFPTFSFQAGTGQKDRWDGISFFPLANSSSNTLVYTRHQGYQQKHLYLQVGVGSSPEAPKPTEINKTINY